VSFTYSASDTQTLSQAQVQLGDFTTDAAGTVKLILAKDATKLLILRFVRDVGRGDITKAWNDGFKNNSTVALASIQPMIDQFNNWMPSFKSGDSLLLTYVPGKGVTVHLNNVQKGIINNDNFVRSLFSIWLGPKPPSSALKKGLLGNHPATVSAR